jgi:hypothetical protein
MPLGNQASEEQEVLRAVQLVLVEGHESLDLFEGVELQIVLLELWRDLRLIDQFQKLLSGNAERSAVEYQLRRGLRLLRRFLRPRPVFIVFSPARKEPAGSGDQEVCGVAKAMAAARQATTDPLKPRHTGKLRPQRRLENTLWPTHVTVCHHRK